jgi:hypothetical protein
MHALIFSCFTYNQQDDDVTKKIEKYASPRHIYPLGPSKCTVCMMFVAEGMGVTKLKTVNILNAVVCLHIMLIMLKVQLDTVRMCFYLRNIFLFPAVERRDLFVNAS